MKPELVIISGPNGSGKTTFSKSFLSKSEDQYDYLNPDEIAERLSPGNIGAVRISAGKEYLILLEELLEKKKSLLIESTLSGLHLKPKIEKFRDYGYEITIIYVFVDNPQVCIERIQERVLKGGHYVADEEVIRRFYRSIEKFWKIYKNIADKWYLFYNADENNKFQEIAIGDKNSYEVSHKVFFEKFISILEKQQYGS